MYRREDKLLLAVSGGVDSVVLCELCKRGGYSFAIAHANFQLRGEESNENEEFVRGLAEKYGVEIFVRRFETKQYAEENKLSIQVAARELRYKWFNELMQKGFDKLLTAHHRDDNIETVLMNFFRGSGISGLHGILPIKNKIVRPLLNYSKEEIITFAKENNLTWREDSSNSSDKYSRNYFRQTIIPLVKNIFPEAEQNIAANIERLREVEILYDQAIALYKKKLVEYKGKEIHIPVLKLKKLNPLSTIVYEIVKEYNFTAHQVPDIINLLDAAQGKYVQSATHRIIKNRNWLIISSKAHADSEIIIIEEGEENIAFAGGSVSIGYFKNEQKKDNAEYLDASLIKYPLILRKWKQGDYFYPLGMHKKKKVSRFLIDNKVSPTQKENTWVLETDKRICWIVGMRIDDRFKIKENTKNLIS
ncbi:MAG: tRNA lysidine(34) synthetase TilS, partial [Chitinophagaceae bacterium]|nr:tRNA lysidine(34) synthetase TilS [Chitinophagaceae bacterium]